MSYSPQLGVERFMFLDDARAVADWDAQFDPIVPLERRDRQEVDAVRHEPAGVLRELQRRQERRDVLRAGSRRRLDGGGRRRRRRGWYVVVVLHQRNDRPLDGAVVALR